MEPLTDETGLHIYMAGVGIQQILILLFLVFAIRFHLELLRMPATSERETALIILFTLYMAVALIMVCFAPPLTLRALLKSTMPGTYYLPSDRIFQRTKEHDPKPRSISVLS